MEKEFVPYELALRLKALGFDEPCFGLYAPPSKTVFLHHYGLLRAKEQVLAPLYQQAFRWFRETHDLACYIYRTNFTSYEWVIDIDEAYAQDSELDYTSYEKAELACLEKLLEIVESKSE